jgi:hypothetical protein
MRSSTTENHISRLKSQLDSLYSNAKYSRPSVIELRREIQAFYDRNADTFQRLPDWARGKIHTYSDVKWQQLTRLLTRGFYIMPDGRKVPSWCAWDSFSEEEKDAFKKDGKCGRLVILWMKETVENLPDGSVQITLTPTDRVYFESQN